MAPRHSPYESYQPSGYQLLQPNGPAGDPALDRLLATYPAAQTTAQPVIAFHVRTPNVRMRTRVDLVLTPIGDATDVDTALNTVVLGGTGTLWAAIKRPLNAQSRKAPPVTNVVSTKASPLAIPTDTGLWGYGFEIETCGDEIFLSFVPPVAKAGNVTAAEWHALVSYESVVRLTDEEWQQFRQRYALNVPAPVVLT